MEIDWAQVKKITLWNYEELIQKILHVFSYDFVQEHYNKIGKKYSDFQNVIPLYWMVGGAKTIPRIVEQ